MLTTEYSIKRSVMHIDQNKNETTISDKYLKSNNNEIYCKVFGQDVHFLLDKIEIRGIMYIVGGDVSPLMRLCLLRH